MAKLFTPMLASLEMPDPIRFPVYGSFKIDGIRGRVGDAILLSRSNKPIPNIGMQTALGRSILEGLDGELIGGDNPALKNLMQLSTSVCMTEDDQRPWNYFVFDLCSPEWLAKPFEERHRALASAFINTSFTNQISPRIHLLQQHLIENQFQLDELEEKALAAGYEGLICKDPAAPYKFGRSTAKQGWSWKVKRFKDGECRVVGSEEEMYNGNEATINELGHTARSSHKANKVPKGTLGALQCVDVVTGVSVRVGTGFTAAQRLEFWGYRDRLVGRLVKYKHFPHGVKDKPRHPVFLGFRDERDM